MSDLTDDITPAENHAVWIDAVAKSYPEEHAAWLAGVKADAWAEGLYAAHKEHNEGTDEPRNPYREGTS